MSVVGFRACRADGVLALPKVGQASHLLLPTSLALTLRAAELWESRDTHAIICVVPSFPRPSRAIARGASQRPSYESPRALAYQTHLAVTPSARGDLPAPGASRSIRLDRLQKRLPSTFQAVKPCSRRQPFVPHSTLRPHTVTSVPYHVEAG